ncbi:hypothetical protein BKA61DRAFT_663541 [Leptodontidium sp. MPI-SDFR-AT-0119]|nr:hypothetical protein BKA61DRAFT_663541 [Leptodontidium sp. MPI-SDFR-AT-0119]
MSSSSSAPSQSSTPNPNPNPQPSSSSPEHKTEYPIPPQVQSAIETLKGEGKRVVVMTCGIAGSGKSTLARSLEHTQQFTRLSIDKSILERHGVYGKDYDGERVGELQDEAEASVKAQMKTLLGECGGGVEGEGEGKEKRDGEGGIVLDLSLWCKADRDFYRGVVDKEGGGRWGVVLAVFKVKGDVLEKERVLWRRIEGRERKVSGRRREGMPVSREVLGEYLRGFEWPGGEGEVFVDVV